MDKSKQKYNKVVTFINEIGGKFMDLSKVISWLKNAAKHSAILLVGILIGMLLMFLNGKNAQADFGRSDISLTDIQIGWVPETEQIFFVDRKTNSITKLSKDVVFAIFSLKMASMQQDYTTVTNTKPASSTINTKK